MINKYKIGQKVRCLFTGANGSRFIKGEVFTITYVDTNNVYGVTKTDGTNYIDFLNIELVDTNKTHLPDYL